MQGVPCGSHESELHIAWVGSGTGMEWCGLGVEEGEGKERKGIEGVKRKRTIDDTP